MLSLTRKADYALIALVDLGQRHRRHTGPASARQIAEAFDLPLPLLMNTLKELARAGIVRSTRGVGGGYELAADPAEVSLLDVVTTLEGPLPPEASPEAPPEAADSPVLRRLHGRITGFLEALSLADLLDEADVGQGPEARVVLQTAARPDTPAGRSGGGASRGK